MTRQNTREVISGHDLLLVVLELMRALALSVLSEHTEEAGLCAVCGSAWLGERVVVATHNLAVI
ncbi:MAG: hypothetical protein ACRDSL_07480 [Pseudonocardiaceae bacterium]